MPPSVSASARPSLPADPHPHDTSPLVATDPDRLQPRSDAARFRIAAVILCVCIISFVLQTELTKIVQTSMGYQKPYFILYISHSFWAMALLFQFFYTAYFSPTTPPSASSLQDRIAYFTWLIQKSTSDLYHKRRDYTVVGAAADNYASPSSWLHGNPASTIYTSQENRILSRHLFRVTLGMTILFMIPSYLWYTCVAMTSMANLTAIYNTSCFFAYLFSVLLLNEAIVMNKILAVFLSLFGVAIISLTTRSEGENMALDPESGRTPISLLGDILALLGAALYGFEEVVYKKYASPKVHSIVFANTLTGLMGVVTFTMLWIPIPLLHWTGHEIFELPTLRQFSSILLVAAMGLIYNGCFMIVVSQTSPVFAAVGIMATIPLVALTDWILFSQAVGWGNIVGGLSILVGFGILVRENQKTMKLAPKLNGANVSSNQGTSQTSATGSNQITTLAGSGTRPLHVTSNARPPSNSITPQSAGIKSAAGSGQGLSTKRPNPFDKGFPGLDNQPPLTVSANIPHGLKATAAKDRSNNTTKGPSLERSAHVQVYQGSTSNARPSGRGQQALVDRPLMPVGSERDTGNDHLDSAWLANPSQIKEIERDTPDSWSSTPPAPLSQTSQQSLLSPKQVPVRATTLSQSVSSVTVSGSSSKKPEKATTVRGSFSKKLETTTTTAISNPSNAPNQLSIRSSSPTIKSSAVAQLVTVVYSNNVAPKAPLTSATSRPSTSRPEGQDTVDRRNSPAHQKQPNPVIEIQDNERRGLLRSNSSPSAASSSSPQFNRPKRRLPGPAGNLPILSAEEKEQLFRSRGVPFTKDTRITVVGITGSDSSIKKRIEPIHQGPIDSMFANGAWDDMLKAYRLPDYRPSTLLRWKGTHPMIKYSISDIERTMELHHGKFPNLVAMIKELVPSEIDAAVTLLDPSGEMRGTIHKTVLEQYKNNEIRIGTVLALQNVSVFSPRTASHYLIITLRNIGALFQPHPPTMMLSQGSSQDKESQRKRKSGPDSQDSQEGKTGNTSFSNPGGAVLADPSPKSEPLAHSNTNLSPQSSFYDLDDSILNHHLSQEGHQKTVKSAPPSQSKKQKQVHPKPALGRLSQGDSYTQEINFQSLQQPFDSSIAPDRYNKSQNDDVEPTPIIPLGTSTPVIASTMSILASFAAAPSLRKRTSSTTSHLETRSSPQRAIPNPRVLASPISPTITRSDPADISNLSDWPDDLGDIDLEALEEDSNGLVNPQPDQMEEPVGSSVGGMYKVDMLATVESNVDDNGDDDLDRLLDGLDEDAFDDL